MLQYIEEMKTIVEYHLKSSPQKSVMMHDHRLFMLNSSIFLFYKIGKIIFDEGQHILKHIIVPHSFTFHFSSRLHLVSSLYE